MKRQAYDIKAIGQVLKYAAQAYECIGFRDTTRKDGTPSRYALLRSHCADCKAEFQCTSAVSGVAFQPNRRCDLHKAAGVPIGKTLNKTTIRELRKELAAQKAKNAETEKALRAVSKRLARYELSDEENKRYADHCAQVAKERRARLERLKTPKQAKSVFD